MRSATLGHREIRLGDVRFPYFLGYDCLDAIAWSIGRLAADHYFVVTDDTVWNRHGKKFFTALSPAGPVTVLSAPAGEQLKSIGHLSGLLHQALRAGASRDSVVVAFGGGVPGNLAGVLAGLLFRGVRLVHVPTTTVAAMDSTVSLKQAVNSDYGKNHIGTYFTPQAVYTDIQVLQTLPLRELRSGLCEAAKNALAVRPQTLPELLRIAAADDLAAESVLRWLLEESIAAKSSVTRHDAREQRSGLVLEYGHTVGHAVELYDHRLRGAAGISHGDAVALGMLAAAHISHALGALSADDRAMHHRVAAALGAPTSIPPDHPIDELLDITLADNKRGYLRLAPDEVAMVLLGTLGAPLGRPDRPLLAVPLDAVLDALRALAAPAPAFDCAEPLS
jgi:3-dehydroquinate synthetase